MSVTVYVPRDTAARSVGADEVAERLAAVPDVRVVRNGSRGVLWLEPLVEVGTPDGRVAYGPVSPSDVDGLLAAGLLTGREHPLRLGRPEDLPWLRDQTRVTFARMGVIDPLSAADYEQHGGIAGLRRALEHVPGRSRRGGHRSPGCAAGAAQASPPESSGAPCWRRRPGKSSSCCNADEGDSGTFADRMLMEGDPFTLIEGMTIAAHATGATEGYVYIRSEYPDAIGTMKAAIDIAYAHGWLGERILGSGLRFDLFVRVGAGAYICGEETSMLDSLEGKRGMVRAKPPIPALEGLFGKPTVVNNVLSLAAVPGILADGAASYAGYGVQRSRGTQVFQLAGNIARGGIVEAAFGITLRELVEGYGGGTASGRPVRAVQVGGPLGAYLPASQLDLPMDYEAFAAADAMIGHGGIVVFDDTVDMACDGPLRHGVLRRGVLRQVHAVPGRLGTRGRGDRPDPRRRRPGGEPRAAGRPV